MKKFIAFLSVMIITAIACLGLTACSAKRLVGFDIDLAREVGTELGLEIQFKEINWNAKETELASKTIDVVWNGFTYTADRDNGYYDEERKQQIGGLDFSGFYMKNKQVAVVKKSNLQNYTGNASFKNKRGCAESTSAGETVITETLGATSAKLGKQLDVFTAVKAGNYDFGVIDLTMASEYVISENGAYYDSLAVVDLAEVEEEFYAIAFREGSNLPAVFNYVLAKLYKNGKAEKIAKHYSLDGALYNGFENTDTEAFTLPADGDYSYVNGKGKIIIGYTVFAPMAYFEK